MPQSKKEYLEEFFKLCETRIEILENEIKELEKLRGTEDDQKIDTHIFGSKQRIDEVRMIMLHSVNHLLNATLEEKNKRA